MRRSGLFFGLASCWTQDLPGVSGFIPRRPPFFADLAALPSEPGLLGNEEGAEIRGSRKCLHPMTTNDSEFMAKKKNEPGVVAVPYPAVYL